MFIFLMRVQSRIDSSINQKGESSGRLSTWMRSYICLVSCQELELGSREERIREIIFFSPSLGIKTISLTELYKDGIGCPVRGWGPHPCGCASKDWRTTGCDVAEELKWSNEAFYWMTMKLFSIQKLYESMKQKKQGERQRTQTGTEEAIFF